LCRRGAEGHPGAVGTAASISIGGILKRLDHFVKRDHDRAARLFSEEPEIAVGVVEGVRELKGCFNGPFLGGSGKVLTGPFSLQADEGGMIFTDRTGARSDRQEEMRFEPQQDATFTLNDVTIGLRFHWERRQDQTFQGELVLPAGGGKTLTAVNRIRLEAYLTSVISSEMSAEAPLEMLKAHAVASRSWLMCMLGRRGKAAGQGAERREASVQADEILRWYGREDHALFDVCADDHCQRYQGITKIISAQAAEAVRTTRGLFLVYNREICDARYHKACGGRTENFENTWEPVPVPYLSSVADADAPFDPVSTETAARRWMHTRPDVHCNTADAALLRRVLPDFDQETTDFFRWRASYGREDLETILAEKSGIDFGVLRNLVPLARGPSGRIIALRIEGSKRTVTVGKELEIRRWLSRSHLYSSAFCVSVERDASGLPVRFTLDGAGWGHGVGLCQIGAAVMAEKGRRAEAILKHYFRSAELEKLYD
jgi:SpoIID/LytB domain protein